MTVTVPIIHQARHLSDLARSGQIGRMTSNQSLRRFIPNRFDLQLLSLIHAALEKQIPLAIVLPLQDTRITILLAAAILVDDFVHTASCNARVAVVSKQLGLRQFYEDLYLGRQMHPARLAECYPGMLLLEDGTTSALHGDSPYYGRLSFVPDLTRLERLSRPREICKHGLIIDARAVQRNELHPLLTQVAGQVPLFYFTRDPADSALQLFHEQGVIWAWDTRSLAMLIDEADTPDALCFTTGLPRACFSSTYTVTGPSVSQTDQDLLRLWDDLTVLAKQPGHHHFSLQWVWGVFNILSHLIVPIGIYDEQARQSWHATVIGEVVAKATAFSRNTPHVHEQEYWDILTDDLETAIQHMTDMNAKTGLLMTWVRQQLTNSKKGLILTRNRVSAKVLYDYLQQSQDIPFDWHTSIEIATFADLDAGKFPPSPTDILLTGPLPGGLSGFLASPLAASVTFLAHGPWEAGRIRRQILAATGQMEALARGAIHIEAWNRLFPDLPAESRSLTEVSIHMNCQDQHSTPSHLKEATWDPFTVHPARSISPDVTDAVHSAPTSPYEHGYQSMVPALQITFADGTGYFEPNQRISRIHGKDIQEIAAKSLQAGERILLMDGGARQDLFDHLVEQLEDLPEFAAITLLVQEWQQRIKVGWYRHTLTYQQALAQMHGTTIVTPATIGGWIRGTVHGPKDAEDIYRLGLVLEDSFLTDRWQAIGKALETMRIHRRKFGRMLARAIAGLSTEQLEDQGYFDRRLGIHYSDLARAISVHQVCHVATTLTRVAYASANRLLMQNPSGSSVR
jgi:hypothetical protein